MAVDALRNARYLIIGGTTKAATTSLFFYLKEHPQVCAANWKEVRFFLDDEYPLKSKYRLSDGLEKYADFYAHCSDNKLRVEATPDYLYSVGTPCKIKESLPRAKLLFILREPVSRLISWYKFAKQNDDIASDVSFDEYVRQLAREEGQEGRPQHMLALEQGCYTRCLKSYFEVFNRERLRVAFYEEFQRGPATVLEDICLFASIAPGFYKDFDFKVYNKTETMRHPLVHKVYIGLRFHVRKFTHDKPLVHGSLSLLRQLCEPFYLKLNTRADEHTTVSPSTVRFLKDYYAEEVGSLQRLLDRKVPW